MAKVHDVCELVRGIILDTEGSVYTDNVLLPFIQAAWRDLHAELTARSISLEETSADLNLTASQASITTTSSPALPGDLVAPQRLWEKKTSSSDKFVRMERRNTLPDIDMAEQLSFWQWQNGSIKLVGSTVPVTVRIEYTKMPADLSSGSTITILSAVNFLAWATAAAVAASRGEMKLMDKAQGRADAYLGQIIDSFVQADQYDTAQRTPYGENDSDIWYGN